MLAQKNIAREAVLVYPKNTVSQKPFSFRLAGTASSQAKADTLATMQSGYGQATLWRAAHEKSGSPSLPQR